MFEDSGAQETVFADTGYRTQDTGYSCSWKPDLRGVHDGTGICPSEQDSGLRRLEDFRFHDSGLEISVNDNSELEKYGLQDSGHRTQDTVDQGTVFEDSGAQETVFADTGYRTQDTAAQGTVVQLCTSVIIASGSSTTRKPGIGTPKVKYIF